MNCGRPRAVGGVVAGSVGRRRLPRAVRIRSAYVVCGLSCGQSWLPSGTSTAVWPALCRGRRSWTRSWPGRGSTRSRAWPGRRSTRSRGRAKCGLAGHWTCALIAARMPAPQLASDTDGEPVDNGRKMSDPTALLIPTQYRVGMGAALGVASSAARGSAARGSASSAVEQRRPGQRRLGGIGRARSGRIERRRQRAVTAVPPVRRGRSVHCRAGGIGRRPGRTVPRERHPPPRWTNGSRRRPCSDNLRHSRTGRCDGTR